MRAVIRLRYEGLTPEGWLPRSKAVGDEGDPGLEGGEQGRRVRRREQES